jgi:hypothetical protein
MNQFRSGLAIGEHKEPALEVDLAPPQIEDLQSPGTGKRQKTDCGRWNTLPPPSTSVLNASANLRSSASDRKRCILRTGGFFIPFAGLSSRSFRVTANCKMVAAKVVH